MALTSNCPNCGREIDLNEAEVEYPDVYFECECGENLSEHFSETILINYLTKYEDYGEDRWKQ